MDRIVFAIDGQKGFTLPPGFGGDQLSSGNHAFFICQANGFARAYGFVSSFQSCYAHDGADYKVGIGMRGDRKSTRLNSSHSQISYAVFCLKKKKTKKN